MINAAELLAAHAALAAGGAPGAAPMKAVRATELSEAEAKPDVEYARAPVASGGQGVAGRPPAVQVNLR